MTKDPEERLEAREGLTPEPADNPGTETPNEMEGLRAEVAENRERALRLAAEMENMRRRSARDLENAHRYGHERFAAELLPVADSLDLALGSAESAPEAVREGLQMTLKLLYDIFARHDIEVLDPAGEPFNPEYHEAMTSQPSSEMVPDHVLNVVQKGYRLHDRLLRPARVIVSRAPGE
ncbi:MAG: nucleotide exchange factor GrpE [Gammaproteobacteria bacterium]